MSGLGIQRHRLILGCRHIQYSKLKQNCGTEFFFLIYYMKSMIGNLLILTQNLCQSLTKTNKNQFHLANQVTNRIKRIE